MTNQPSLFDSRGRWIPPSGLKAKVDEPDTDYFVGHHNSFRVPSRVVRQQNALTGLEYLPVTEFMAQLASLTQRIDGDSAITGVFNGPCFPLNMPRLQFKDQGNLLDTKLLPALGQIYQSVYEGRDWTNYREGELEGAVTTHDAGYGRMLEAIQTEPRAAILAFPFQGYSVDAQCEVGASFLPQTTCNITLMGPVDLILAAMTHPEELMRDGSTPGYDASAARWQSAEGSLFLEAGDDEASFGGRGALGNPYGRCSGGLLFW